MDFDVAQLAVPLLHAEPGPTFIPDVMGMYSDKNAGGVSFSQPHGTTMADVDGDGIPDFIVGKRVFSHLDDFYDPDSYGRAVLYWFQTVRNPKAPSGRNWCRTLSITARVPAQMFLPWI